MRCRRWVSWYRLAFAVHTCYNIFIKSVALRHIWAQSSRNVTNTLNVLYVRRCALLLMFY
uniref:Uncharacterized protein n=1 Tax=Anguilla anguilla TaxID=7936 RepID=A0A0E9R8Y9_ANGAN